MTQIRFILKLKDPDSALHALVYSLFAGRCIEQSRVKRSGSLSLSVVKIPIWSAVFSLSTSLLPGSWSSCHALSQHYSESPQNTELSRLQRRQRFISGFCALVIHLAEKPDIYRCIHAPIATGSAFYSGDSDCFGIVYRLRTILNDKKD